MGDYLLLILSALMFSAQIIFSKRYETKNGNTLYATSCFSLVISVVCLIYTLAINGFRIRFEWYSFFLALAYAVIHTLVRLLSIKTISLGKVSIYTLFLMLGGMIVPFLVGVIFLGEELKWHYLVAIALLICALVLPTINFKGRNSESNTKSSKLFFVLCLICFLLNGLGSAVAKIHQVSTAVKVETNDFSVLFSIISLVLSLGVFFVARLKRNKNLLLNKETAICGVGFGLVHMTGLLIQLITATRVDSALLFPLVTGGTLIFTPLLSLAFYKEKINLINIICMAVSFTATVIFAF